MYISTPTILVPHSLGIPRCLPQSLRATWSKQPYIMQVSEILRTLWGQHGPARLLLPSYYLKLQLKKLLFYAVSIPKGCAFWSSSCALTSRCSCCSLCLTEPQSRQGVGKAATHTRSNCIHERRKNSLDKDGCRQFKQRERQLRS